MLQRVNDVDDIAKGEAVVAEKKPFKLLNRFILHTIVRP